MIDLGRLGLEILVLKLHVSLRYLPRRLVGLSWTRTSRRIYLRRSSRIFDYWVKIYNIAGFWAPEKKQSKQNQNKPAIVLILINYFSVVFR